MAEAQISQIRSRDYQRPHLQDDHYTKEHRSLNRALITILIIIICYIFTAGVLSVLFGILSSPISSGEIIFIMVMLSVFRTLFSIVIPIYNFEPIFHVVKEYLGHAKFWVNDTLESIYLYFSKDIKFYIKDQIQHYINDETYLVMNNKYKIGQW